MPGSRAPARALECRRGWLRAAVTMFSPFFPSQVQLFGLGELDAAMEWLNRDDEAGQ